MRPGASGHGAHAGLPNARQGEAADVVPASLAESRRGMADVFETSAEVPGFGRHELWIGPEDPAGCSDRREHLFLRRRLESLIVLDLLHHVGEGHAESPIYRLAAWAG